ncbi:MAG: universal stress protein [Acidimicrobiales bacterium]
MQLLIGFGDHDRSSTALEWSKALADRTGADLAVVSVVHPAFAEVPPELLAQMRRAREETIDRLAGDAAAVVTLEGEGTAELIRYAEEQGPDLLVVGRHDSMTFGGLGGEGAFEQLLRHYRRPFVVVPDNAPPLPSPSERLTVVVGVDGTDANAESVAMIGELTKRLEARTIPIFSVVTMASTTRDHYGSRLVHQDEAEAIAARLPGAEPLRTPNEDPVRGVLDTASWERADLVAIGTRGHRSFTDFFAGQFARHLVDHSPIPVLVAPHHPRPE